MTMWPAEQPAGVPIPVVHIITQLELGGAQQNTLYTVGHLDRRRYRPYLIAGCGGLLDDEARRLADVDVAWVPSLVREIRPWRDLIALLALWRRLRRIRATAGPVMLVHTHSSKAGILGRWAARLAGATAVLHTYHGFGFHPGQSRWLRWLLIGVERMTAAVTDVVITVSQANQRLGAAMGLFAFSGSDSFQCRPPTQRLPPSVLIRSGIDVSAFRPAGLSGRAAMRASLGIPADAPVVITVACLKPQKAPLDLIEVVRRVVARVPAARFVIVGDGELRGPVERMIADGQLQAHVSLLGWRRDVPACLHAADLFLLTSRWEGLPRAVLEAMAAGLPVVATAVDGVTDVVRDGVNGYLVPVGEPEQTAARVIGLLDDPALRRRMGDAAVALSDEFDIDLMVRQQEALYHQVLRGRLREAEGDGR
jgi:glycosyltransferase involved in cell wall biosynthesis